MNHIVLALGALVFVIALLTLAAWVWLGVVYYATLGPVLLMFVAVWLFVWLYERRG